MIPEGNSTFIESLIDASPDAMVVANPKGEILLVNAQAEKLFCYPRAELIGKLVESLLPERLRALHLRYRLGYSTEPRTGPMGVGVEMFGCRKDGSEFPVEISISPLETEDGIFAISAIRDITKRKQADEALRRLSAIVEFSDYAIISESLDGIILSWNRGAERMYGYAAAEAIGKDITFLAPPDLRKQAHEILDLIKRGEEVEQFETVRVRKDGRPIDVSLGASPICDSRGAVVCAGVVARDITRRKQLQRQLDEAARQRAEDLQQFAASVQRAQEEERRRITRELHDELGQRLTGVKLTLDVLEDMIPRADKKTVGKLKSVKQQIEAMITEVRRISSNLRPTALDDFGLTVALRLLCKEFEKLHGLAVEFKPGELAQYNEQVEIAVYRVSQEALSNIAKHANASSVTVELCQSGQALKLNVSDNGKGFDAESVQLQRGQERGLGLMSMRERVMQLGGVLHIVSSPNCGTQIQAEIPVETETTNEEDQSSDR